MKEIISIIVMILCSLLGDSPRLVVGVGGTIVGQEYTILDRDTTSLATEGKILLDLDLKKMLGLHQIDGTISSDIGNKSIWSQIKAEWSHKTNGFDIKASQLLDFRYPYQDVSAALGYKRYRFGLQMNQAFATNRLSAGLSLEGKDFEKNSRYNYDYSMLRSDLGFDFSIFGANADISWNYAYRHVSDSTVANYDLRRIGFSISKLFSGGSMSSLHCELEKQNFSASRIGSYDAFSVNVPLSFVLESFFIEPSADFEKKSFDEQNNIFFDYAWAQFMTEVGKNMGIWSFSAGPKVIFQGADEIYQGENFWDFGLRLSVDCINYEKFWFFLVVEPGKRFFQNMPDTAIFVSDYNFIDVSLFASIALFKNIRADFSATYFPEWHIDRADDFAISYISASVKYEFK